MFLKPPANRTSEVSAQSDLPSIKTAIQTLAYPLWFEKRASGADDVDWLVDGRLADQLDELPKEQLLRINGLLRRTASTRRMQFVTFRTAILPPVRRTP